MRRVNSGRVLAMTLGFMLTMIGVLACGQKRGGESQLLIRGGSPVLATADGPERWSTVGLKGVSRQGVYTCSAAIIHERLLVTAAHCVEKGAKLYAYFGLAMLDADAISDFTPVTQILIHPDFRSIPGSGAMVPHDVALLKLATPIPAGYVVAPILPRQVPLRRLESVRLAGYGITEEGDDSDVLRYVDATYVGEDNLGRIGINDPEKRGACSGDSGGPLYAQRGGDWYMAGVLSGGPIPCRGVNIYTSLAAHRDFVERASGVLLKE